MNESQSYTVSIVIPCRNEKNYIADCLNSIIQTDFDKSRLHVLVCDGESTDGTDEIIRDFEEKYPFIHYLKNTHQTTPHALNLGLKARTFDIGIILGAHAEIDKDYIKNCLQVFEVQKEAGCVGGIIENVHENNTSEAIGMAMSSVFGVGNAHFRTGTKSGFVDTVAFGAYRKEVFETCGYFDEDLVRNQDDEFNYRILKNGFKIWLEPSVKSKYFVRASFKKLYRQYFQYGYWKVFVNKKHNSITTLRQLVPAIWVSYLFGGANFLFLGIPGLLIYLSGIAFYIAASKLFAIKQSKNPGLFIKIMFSFWILHFSYGTGYLKGIVHFLILNKKPVPKDSRLSR